MRHPTLLMPHESPDTLQFFRTELQRLERASEPTMDPTAVADLKRLLIVRIAELETDRHIQGTMDPQKSLTNNEVQDD